MIENFDMVLAEDDVIDKIKNQLQENLKKDKNSEKFDQRI